METVMERSVMITDMKKKVVSKMPMDWQDNTSPSRRLLSISVISK